MKLSELLCTLSYLKIVSGFESIDFFFFQLFFFFFGSLSLYLPYTKSEIGFKTSRSNLHSKVQIQLSKYSHSVSLSVIQVIQCQKKHLGVIIFLTLFTLCCQQQHCGGNTSFREITLEKFHGHYTECLKRKLAFLDFKHDRSFD